MARDRRVVREGRGDSTKRAASHSPAAKITTKDLYDRPVLPKSPAPPPAGSSPPAAALRSPFEGLAQTPSHTLDSAATEATLRQRNSWLESELRRTKGDAAALRDRVVEVEERAREASRVNQTLDHAMVTATEEIEAVVAAVADAITRDLLPRLDPAATPERRQRPSQAVRDLVQALAEARADLAPSKEREEELRGQLAAKEHEVWPRNPNPNPYPLPCTNRARR